MSSAGPERRLAAILSADVAGYSRLMADDEDATVRTLRAWREQVGALITEHRGRIADFTGDNFLAEFPAARDAVECALEIQRVVAARNAALPEARRMRFRIGAHLGDVRHEDGRLFGDGVNLAARLQPLAEPGGLCLSAMIVEAVHGQIALALEDIGEQALKNLPSPVHAFRVRVVAATEAAPPAPLGPAPRPRAKQLTIAAIALTAAVIGIVFAQRDREAMPAPTAPALAPIRSLAVLPLTNLSGDPEQEYFADGMTETLIAELAKLPGVRVISRTSVMQFKGTRTPLSEIARRLNVDGVIEGSVMRAGNEVRITAQLVDARRDEHVWAEQYDRELARVLEIQSEVARAVANQIQLTLSPQQVSRLAAPKAADPRAQDAYFRGLAQRGLVSDPENMRRSISAFEDAIAIAPEYAPAFAGLATSRSFLWILDGAPLVAQARQAALRAVELDESLGDAHTALARILFLHDFEWAAAEREFRRGIELGASDPLNRSSLAFLLLATDRRNEAFAWMDEVVASAPFDFFVRTASVSLQLQGGRPEVALEEANRILSINPDYAGGVSLRIFANEQLGRFDEAIRDWQRLAELVPRRAELTLEVERSWRSEGPEGYWRAAALDPLRGNFLRAAALTQIGAFDEAFALLELAYQARDARIAFLLVYEPFAPLRSDPRYSELLRRMNLPLPEP